MTNSVIPGQTVQE